MKNVTSLLLGLLILSFTSCDSESSYDDIDFRDAELAQVQSTLQGVWELTGSTGYSSDGYHKDIIFEQNKYFVCIICPACLIIRMPIWEDLIWEKEPSGYYTYTTSEYGEKGTPIKVENGILHLQTEIGMSYYKPYRTLPQYLINILEQFPD